MVQRAANPSTRVAVMIIHLPLRDFLYFKGLEGFRVYGVNGFNGVNGVNGVNGFNGFNGFVVISLC